MYTCKLAQKPHKCTHTHINVCMSVCMSACLSIYLSIYLSMHTCMYICMCICMYLCMYVCIYLFDTSHWMSLSLPWNIIFVLSTLQKHLAAKNSSEELSFTIAHLGLSKSWLSQGYPLIDRPSSLQISFLGGERSKLPMNVPSLFKMMLQQRFLSGK